VYENARIVLGGGCGLLDVIFCCCFTHFFSHHLRVWICATDSSTPIQILSYIHSGHTRCSLHTHSASTRQNIGHDESPNHNLLACFFFIFFWEGRKIEKNYIFFFWIFHTLSAFSCLILQIFFYIFVLKKGGGYRNYAYHHRLFVD
jgi:hypothetical protein